MCDLINGEYEVKSGLYLNDALQLIEECGFVEIHCENNIGSGWMTLDTVSRCWSVRRPKQHPAELQGFVEDAFGKYKKHLTKDVWVNVFYNRYTGDVYTNLYETEYVAKHSAKSNNDTFVFIKTLHLSQQYSIQWQDSFNKGVGIYV